MTDCHFRKVTNLLVTYHYFLKTNSQAHFETYVSVFLVSCHHFRWLVSEWSKCSASCGSGWKQRQVSCQQLDARGGVRTLTAAACERMSRPADTEQCTANNCPTWVTSPWGKVQPNTELNICAHCRKCILKCQLYVNQFQCSGRCFSPTTTVQKRSVICQHANGSSYTDCDLRDRYTHTLKHKENNFGCIAGLHSHKSGYQMILFTLVVMLCMNTCMNYCIIYTRWPLYSAH